MPATSGAPSHKGSVAYDAARKEYRITGGGNNMWGVRDDFFLVWKKITGDVLIIRKDLEPTISSDESEFSTRRRGG